MSGPADEAVEVRQTPDGRGRGLYLLRAHQRGDIILEEHPLVAMQSLPQQLDVAVCAHCFRFVGTLEQQLALLAGDVDRRGFAAHGSPPKDRATPRAAAFSDAVPCSRECGELYCSVGCRERHWERCHRFVCTGCIDEAEAAAGHPLIDFKLHAIDTNEIFLLVAAVVCDCWSRVLAGKEPYAAYRDFVQERWWDCVAAEDDTELRSALREITGEAQRLFAAAAERTEAADPTAGGVGIRFLMDRDRWGRIVGMFEQNNVGIRALNPAWAALKELVRDARAGDAPATAYLQSIAPVLSAVAEAVEDGEDGEDGEEGKDGDSDECWGSDDDCKVGEDAVEAPGGGRGDGDGGASSDEEKASDEDGGAPADAEDAEDDMAWSAEEALDLAQALLDGRREKMAAIGVPDEHGGGDEVVEALSRVSPKEEYATAVESAFPPLDGTALFSTICTINHACDPNVRVVYRYSAPREAPEGEKRAAPRLVACLVALRDIGGGEELLQSYIDPSDPLDQRRADLADYGFTCQCARCRREEGELAG